RQYEGGLGGGVELAPPGADLPPPGGDLSCEPVAGGCGDRDGGGERQPTAGRIVGGGGGLVGRHGEAFAARGFLVEPIEVRGPRPLVASRPAPIRLCPDRDVLGLLSGSGTAGPAIKPVAWGNAE